MSKQLEEGLKEAKRRGLYIPTEDINSNLQRAIEAACVMTIEQNGLQPMLDVVMRLEDGGDMQHVGAVFENVDFSNKKEKLKAMLEAGKQMGRDLGHEMLPMQVILMSEAWQRTDPENLENKQEIVMAATRSWDGREGFIGRRTIHDAKDVIIDTCPTVEDLATDEKAKHETPLLNVFFLGFGIGAAATNDVEPELKEQAKKLDKELSTLFS